MARRWKILVCVGLIVAVLDQWTKCLAVRHLTPGIAKAHFAEQNLFQPTLDERRQALESLGVGDALWYFYANVKDPCRSPDAYCPTVNVIDGFWAFRYVENRGAAWGLLSNANASFREPFFYVVSTVALVFIFWFFRRLSEQQRLLIWSLSLVFGGAIGNFIDRAHLGYVVDFIDWYIGDAHWPTFNVADSAITVGVGLLVLDMIVSKKTSESRRNESKSRAESA